MSSIDEGLAIAMSEAYGRAAFDRAEYVTQEHLLLGLIKNEQIEIMLGNLDIDIREVQGAVEALIVKVTAEMGKLADGKDPVPTVGVQRVVQQAIDMAKNRAFGRELADCLLVFFCLIQETESEAAYLLQESGVVLEDVEEWIEHMSGYAYEGTGAAENGDGRKSAIDLFTVNLNQLAENGKIDPIIGRAEELDRVMQVLCRRRKNNPILVGEAGVGKTAIAEGLAYRITRGEVPEVLKGFEVYSLDLGGMLAGSRFRGEFEERLKMLVNEFEAKDNAILFLDEIHQIVGAGAQEGGAGDAATLLKPALAKGTLRVIGATTYEELRKILSRDTALMRRFQKVDVSEPGVEDTIGIIRGLQERFEAYHQVRFAEDAIVAAVELSSRYMTDRKLPDKAIDVIDEAGSQRRLHPKAGDDLITKADVEAVVAKMARIPPQAVSTDDRERLRHLEESLKGVIYGQDAAVEAVTDAIKLARSGLGRADRPIGSFLFSGPTGVGKTELARQLAASLGIELIRFDMSEYMERHAVSRLIGAPPGYVGFDQGGLLTEAVNKKPHAVLLLDEIEKAHADIYNILLQVMDHGSLTDNNGRTADFRNVIIIMTTNAGSEALGKTAIGFVDTVHKGDEAGEIRRTFTPEFRNRLDGIISFAPLGKESIGRVVDKFLLEIEKQLLAKDIHVTFSDAMKQYLGRKGFDPHMGARPMARLIQSTIRKALADELLFGDLSKSGGRVYVDCDEDGKVKLTVEAAVKS